MGGFSECVSKEKLLEIVQDYGMFMIMINI